MGITGPYIEGYGYYSTIDGDIWVLFHIHLHNSISEEMQLSPDLIAVNYAVHSWLSSIIPAADF